MLLIRRGVEPLGYSRYIYLQSNVYVPIEILRELA